MAKLMSTFLQLLVVKAPKKQVNNKMCCGLIPTGHYLWMWRLTAINSEKYSI
jgi:hypothetical protein